MARSDALIAQKELSLWFWSSGSRNRIKWLTDSLIYGLLDNAASISYNTASNGVSSQL
jgi:hypothetical protein